MEYQKVVGSATRGEHQSFLHRYLETVRSGRSQARERYRRPARIHVAIWCLLSVLFVGVSLWNYDSFQVGAYGDDASYIVLAKSLLSGRQYGLINNPGQVGTTQFPFGFPLLLAPFVLLFNQQLDLLKLFSLGATLCNAALIFWGWPWLGRGKSYTWALAILAMYLFSPLGIEHSRMVMSEPIFTTFCLAAIILAEKAVRDRSVSDWWTDLLAIALIFVLFTRTVGVALLISLIAYLLYYKGRKYWKELALLLVTMVVYLVVIVGLTPLRAKDLIPQRYLNSHQGSIFRNLVSTISLGQAAEGQPTAPEVQAATTEIENETEQISRLERVFIDVILLGTREHFGSDIRQVIFPFGKQHIENIANNLKTPWLIYLPGLIASAIIMVGYGRLAAEKQFSLFMLFGIAYFGMLMLWIWAGSRLLYPIQFQLYFGFLLGAETILSKVGRWMASRFRRTWSPRTQTWAGIALLAPLLLAFAYESTDIENSRQYIGDLSQRTAWLNANTTPRDIILTEAPVVDYLYGERKTLLYPLQARTFQQFERYLVNKKVDYILLSPKIAWQTQYTPVYSARTKKVMEWVERLAAQNRTRLVHSSEENMVRVYQIVR